MSIQVQNLSRRFGEFNALDRVSVDISKGELVALLGPSGSGKTTLLRIIAGLDHADGGQVLVDGNDIANRSARDRNVGFVFQHYALFRHLTAFENVAFGLRVRGWKQSAVEERVGQLLSLVRLADLGHRYPAELSGGQRQRVALARALAARPEVLLLDEPFGALDAKVRQELRQWLRRLHDEVPVTTLFVTHDQEEAFEVADKVVMMNRGRIEQVGTPQELFDHPANPFVMDFLGQVNVFHGRVENGKARLGHLELDCPEVRDARDSAALPVYVRPHEVQIHRQQNEEGSFAAEVLHVNPAGSVTRVQVFVRDLETEICVDLPASRGSELALRKGDSVFVSPQRVKVFTPEYSI